MSSKRAGEFQSLLTEVHLITKLVDDLNDENNSNHRDTKERIESIYKYLNQLKHRLSTKIIREAEEKECEQKQ